MKPAGDRPAFIKVRLSLLTSAEGERDAPITTGYMPNWRRPGIPAPTLASGTVELLDTEKHGPGATATARVYPFVAEVWQGVEVGAELDVSEGPQRTIGKAIVTRVVPAAVPVG